MGGLFSYDSKPMQILMFVGDLIILNILYLICCIPIFTIGAAQAGMYTACKVLLDKEDDSSPYAAFWRGFKRGFGTITLAWGLLTLLLLVITYGAVTAYVLGAPAWLMILAVALCVIFQTLVPAFHARFGCTWWQLIRNVFFLLFAHPLRSIGTVLAVNGSLIYLVLYLYMGIDFFDLMFIAMICLFLYYSTAFCVATSFLKKPFKTLIDHFNETHGLDKDGNPLPPAEDTMEDITPEDLAENPIN